MDRKWNTDVYLKEVLFTLAIKWISETSINLLGVDISLYNDPRGGKPNVLEYYYQDEKI